MTPDSESKNDDQSIDRAMTDPETAKAAEKLGEQMSQLVDLKKALSASPGLKAAAESMKQMNEALDSAAFRSTAESIARMNETFSQSGITEAIQRMGKSLDMSSSVKAISDSMARLNSIPRAPDFNAMLKDYVSPEVRTVTTLHEVRGELAGMATILEESARQQAVLVEVTRANLTATQALIGEEQKTRESSARSDRVLIWLTVALFLVSVVGAVALAAAFGHQLSDWWSWLRSSV